MSTQSNNSGFIEKSQKEKELLDSFWIWIFEDLYHPKWRIEIKYFTREYKKQDFIKKRIEENTNKYTRFIRWITIKKDELNLN